MMAGRRCWRRLLLLVLAVAPLIAAAPVKQTTQTPEQWAWAQITQGLPADFGPKCNNGKPSPDPAKPEGWNDDCRKISAKFVVDMLTVPKQRDRIARHQVFLRGARIVGDVDLSGADIAEEVWLRDCRLEGSLKLAESRWDRILALEGTVVTGGLNAEQITTKSHLLVRYKSVVEGAANLRGGKIGGDLDFYGASFAKSLTLESSDIDGTLYMQSANYGAEVTVFRAKVGLDAMMGGSTYAQDVSAAGMNVAGNLRLDEKAKFGGKLSLLGARVGGDMALSTSIFDKDVSADRLDVVGNMFLDNAVFGGAFTLIDAKIETGLVLNRASFAGNVLASRINVASSIFGPAKFGGDLRMEDAKIGDALVMGGSTVTGTFDATNLTTGGNVLLDAKAAFKGDVVLDGARIGSELSLSSSSFDKTVTLDNIRLGGGMYVDNGAKFAGAVTMRDASIGIGLTIENATFGGETNFQRARIANNVGLWNSGFAGLLDLRGANFGWLSLSGSTLSKADLSELVTTELAMSGLQWKCADGTTPVSFDAQGGKSDSPGPWKLGDAAWKTVRCDGEQGDAASKLILRNVHATYFQDSADTWPFAVDMEGFRFDQLGGLHDDGREDMRRRSAEQWTDLIARDHVYSPQPYTQLAAVLLAAGHRDIAEDVQLAGRDRERDALWSRHDAYTWPWFENDLFAWGWFSLYASAAGYGVGLHTFRVLKWVVVLIVLGAFVLQLSEDGKKRNFFWRAGASLNRLLPVIDLTKEFKEYFDNAPDAQGRRPLNRFQVVFFVGIAMLGWILGAILLAAVGALTPK
jgi:hypothetical protein